MFRLLVASIALNVARRLDYIEIITIANNIVRVGNITYGFIEGAWHNLSRLGRNVRIMYIDRDSDDVQLLP